VKIINAQFEGTTLTGTTYFEVLHVNFAELRPCLPTFHPTAVAASFSNGSALVTIAHLLKQHG
jgi:hypothetical protein